MTCEITAQRAREFGVAPQAEGESDYDFRHRVSAAIRKQGHIIEAHEAFRNALYDQADNVMTGIVGALAQAMQGVDYGTDVGTDIAAGIVTQAPPKDNNALLAMLMLMMR